MLVLKLLLKVYVMRCSIWYHLYNLKNVKNTHVGVLLLVKLQVPNHALHHTCTKKITRIILRRALKTSSLWLWI